MDVQHIIDILFALLGGIMGFFMKNLHSKTERTADDLARYKEHVALNYPVNDSIDKRFDKLEVKIDKFEVKIDKILEKMDK